jgi:protein-tyrosine phosphatase
MIDLHCHVLPGIDDGPATMEESLELGRAAARSGVKTLVATPHVSRRYPNGPRVIRERVQAVQSALRVAGVELEIRPGAEIAHTRLEDLSDEDLCGLRMGDGPWLMIESPLAASAADFEAALDAVHARGHWIVLAHPERSPLFRRDPRRLGALVARGVLCSLTASSLVGVFGSHVRRFALALVREGLVHNVTSDAHDPVRRPPSLAEDILVTAARVPELRDRVEWLTCDMPRAILEGDVLPKQPATARSFGGAAPRSFR